MLIFALLSASSHDTSAVGAEAKRWTAKAALEQAVQVAKKWQPDALCTASVLYP